MVTFSEIGTSIRSPIVTVEFGASNAQQGPLIQVYKALAIGQRTTGAGTGVELELDTVTTADQVGALHGYDSQLYWLARSWFSNNRVTQLDVVAIDDPSGGTAAQGRFVVTGTATGAGTLAVYVAGRRYQIGVAVGDTATAVGAAIAAAIQADASAPVSAANVTGTVTCTAINLGVDGDDIDLRVGYAGELLPAGIAVAVTAMGVTVAGAGSVDITEVWPLIANEHYNVLAVGMNDQTNLTALNVELADRWGPSRMAEGVAVLGARGNQSTLTTLGNANNSPHIVVIGADASPTPPWAWAGALAGVVARFGQADPARPFHTLPLVGVLAPATEDVFTFAENEILLTDGIATFSVSGDGTVRLGSTVTTYQTNPLTGGPDDTFLHVQTPLTLGYIRYDARLSFSATFGRHKLADDSLAYDAGQFVVTPSIARAFFLGKFRQWEGRGLVEGFDQFKADLVVERNDQDRNRLDCYLPPDLINQLRVTAMRIGFLL